MPTCRICGIKSLWKVDGVSKFCIECRETKSHVIDKLYEKKIKNSVAGKKEEPLTYEEESAILNQFKITAPPKNTFSNNTLEDIKDYPALITLSRFTKFIAWLGVFSSVIVGIFYLSTVGSYISGSLLLFQIFTPPPYWFREIHGGREPLFSIGAVIV